MLDFLADTLAVPYDRYPEFNKPVTPSIKLKMHDYAFFPIVLSCPGNLTNDKCFINSSLRYAAVMISQWAIANCIPVNTKFIMTGFTDCDNYRFEASTSLNGKPLTIIAYCEDGLMNIVSRYDSNLERI